MSLILRQKAVETVMARFEDKPFVWGQYDCARLAAAMMKAMGHKVSLAAFGAYSSEIGALRALKRAGYDGLEQAIDARLPKIAPAMALPGDILGLDGEGGAMPALTVYLGNGVVLGWCGAPCTTLRVLKHHLAWSVACPM